MEQSELGDEAPDAVDEDGKRDVVAQATGMLAAQFELNTEAAHDKLTTEAATVAAPSSAQHAKSSKMAACSPD